MVVEEDPVFLQSATVSQDSIRAKDGFYIAFHEVGTFPTYPVHVSVVTSRGLVDSFQIMRVWCPSLQKRKS